MAVNGFQKTAADKFRILHIGGVKNPEVPGKVHHQRKKGTVAKWKLCSGPLFVA